MNLLDLVFPKYCFNCGIYGNYICKSCISRFKFVWHQKCHVCRSEIFKGMVHSECQENTYLDGVIGLFYYNKVAKKFIRKVKYDYTFDLIKFVIPIYIKFLKYYKLDNNSIVTAVPMHDYKIRLRGFNQADILATNLAKHLKLEYRNIIKRDKYTKTQVLQKRDDRLKNLKDVFILENKDNLPKIVYLTDDIFTTGATLNECAKLLKANGVEKVYGLVLGLNI